MKNKCKNINKKTVLAIATAIIFAFCLCIIATQCGSNNPENAINIENPNTSDLVSPEDTPTNPQPDVNNNSNNDNPSSDKPAQPETDEDSNKPKNEETANPEGLNDDNSNSDNHNSPNSPAPTNPEPPESSNPSAPEVSKPPAEPTPSPSPSPAPSPTPAPMPHSHSFGEWKTVKKPTCTEPGEQQRTCSCGKTETRSIKAKDHKWETRTRIEEVEEYHQICNGCGYIYPLNPLDKNFLLPDGEWGDAFLRHSLWDENGNERTPEDFSKHAAYHGDYVMVKKEVEYQVCTVCRMEK